MKVSVLMVTYNQAEYIAQAIESVLMQETDFEVELVIGDDCSTDHTREILLDLQTKNPNKIKLLQSERNLGVNKNIARTLQACTGQYLAILDGDDYWLSPHKLQVQVDYLDNHQELTVCFHNALIVSKEGNVLRESAKPDQKPISTLEDIIQRNFIVSCTVMYRNGLVHSFPDWWHNILSADWTLHIFHAQHGDIGYIPEIMAAYRFNPQGIWSRLQFEDKLEMGLRFYTQMNSYLNYQYNSIIQPALSEHWRRLHNVFIGNGIDAGVENPNIQNISTIFENWPQDLPFPPRWKADVLTEIYTHLLFLHSKNHHPTYARYCCIELALLRPSRFRNKGTLKVGINSILDSYFLRFRNK